MLKHYKKAVYKDAKKNNLKQYLDPSFKEIDNKAKMKAYYKKLQWVLYMNKRLKLPNRTMHTSHFEILEKSAKDIKRMKLFNITTFKVDQLTDDHVAMVNTFYNTFIQAQKTNKFRPLEKLTSFRSVLKPDDDKDYKQMESSEMYQSYPTFIDKCKFETREEKLFVLFMMCKSRRS